MSSEQKNYSIFSIAMNLTVACMIAGLIIAVTYTLTKDTAEKARVMLKNDAMKKLVPDANSFTLIEGKTEWYKAEKDGRVLAYIVPSESKGYGGMLKMIVAVDLEGKVISYKILSPFKETPGLGDKATKPAFRLQFTGKTIKHLEVTKDPANKEDILAISGATITSRGVTKSVKLAVEAVAQFAGGK